VVIHYVLAQTPLLGPVTTVCQKEFSEYELAWMWDSVITGQPLPDTPIRGLCKKCLQEPLGSGILYGVKQRKVA
jgi:hypothetical protein